MCAEPDHGFVGQRQRQGSTAGDRVDVSHFATGLAGRLAIPVNRGVRIGQLHGERLVGAILPQALTEEDIHHGRRGAGDNNHQGQARYGAHMLLKLRDVAGVEGNMARVVNPGRDLVDQQLVARGDKHFDSKHADPAHQGYGPLGQR